MVGPEHKVEQREIIDLETSSVSYTDRCLREGMGVREKGQRVPGQQRKAIYI